MDDVTRALPHALGPEKSLLSSILQDPQEYIGIAIEEMALVVMYQPRLVQIVSTSGAHMNFQVWGSVFIATIPATALSGNPALPARKPIVTEMNPAVAPNGRNSRK